VRPPPSPSEPGIFLSSSDRPFVPGISDVGFGPFWSLRAHVVSGGDFRASVSASKNSVPGGQGSAVDTRLLSHGSQTGRNGSVAGQHPFLFQTPVMQDMAHNEDVGRRQRVGEEVEFPVVPDVNIMIIGASSALSFHISLIEPLRQSLNPPTKAASSLPSRIRRVRRPIFLGLPPPSCSTSRPMIRRWRC